MKSIKFRKIGISKKWLLRSRRQFLKVHGKTMSGNFSVIPRIIRKKRIKEKPLHFLVKTHAILHVRESGTGPQILKWARAVTRLREIHEPTHASVRYHNTISFGRHL